jgi:hypothetical protein
MRRKPGCTGSTAEPEPAKTNMTATTSSPTDAWTQQLDQLRARYKHLRPAVLAALNILIDDENVSIDDAKARADLHGVRITAASLNAARTVLAKMTSPREAPASKEAPPRVAEARRAPRRQHSTEIPFDAEALVRGVVAKIQGQGNAEVERLRDAMRKAVDLLSAAIR